MISTFDSYGRFFKPGVLFAIVSYWPVKVQLMDRPIHPAEAKCLNNQ